MIVCRRKGHSRTFNFKATNKEIDQSIVNEFSEKVIQALKLISNAEFAIEIIRNSKYKFTQAIKEEKDFYIYELKLPDQLYEKISNDFANIVNKEEIPSYMTNIFDTFNIAFDVIKNIGITDSKDPNIWYIAIRNELENPKEEEENNLFYEFKQNGNYPKHGIQFKSYTEKVVFLELIKYNLLIIALPTVILGNPDCHKEPDFIILHKNKLGILEVCGEKFHKTEKDHERRRLFINWGIKTVEFYDASECYNNPKQVVESFLKILKNS